MTHIQGALCRGHPTQRQELLQVAVLHDGVGHDGDIVILHTHMQERLDVGVLNAPEQRRQLKELGDLVTMTVLLLKTCDKEFVTNSSNFR